MPVFFPDTVTLSLQRYKVNKWDEIEKDRTNIYPDFYVNFKKYTTREEEMIYALESVVLHKGEQPTSGHYTALRKAQGSFILIDDEQVRKYHGSTLEKDGYLFIYSSLKIPESRFIYLTCCCISNSAIHASLEFHLSNTTFTSPVKKQILDRFANFRLQSIAQEVPTDSKLLYLIHHSQVKVRCTVEYLNDVVKYLVDQYPQTSKQIIGFDVLQHFACDSCNQILGKTMHLLDLNQIDIDLYKNDCFTVQADCQCGGKMTGQQVISKFGNTVFMHASPSTTESFPNMRIHLSDVANVIFPKVSYEFKVSVCFIPDEETIILFSNTSCIMLDKSEEITPLSFDQFHEVTSLKPTC